MLVPATVPKHIEPCGMTTRKMLVYNNELFRTDRRLFQAKMDFRAHWVFFNIFQDLRGELSRITLGVDANLNIYKNFVSRVWVHKKQ